MGFLTNFLYSVSVSETSSLFFSYDGGVGEGGRVNKSI